MRCHGFVVTSAYSSFMKLSKMTAFALVFLLVGCGSNSISMPDLKGVDEKSAKAVLASQQLIPKVEYEFSDEIDEGNVIRSEPDVSEAAEKNSAVKLFVSKGPSIIQSTDSSIEWYHVGYAEDDWNFTSPRIEDGYLIIDCEVKFGSRLSWYDPQSRGDGFGRASINDKFDKTVPVNIISEKLDYKPGVRESFSLKLSVNDLDNPRPTDLYLELYANVNRQPSKKSSNKDVKVNFSISWPN